MSQPLTRPLPHGLQGWKLCPVCGGQLATLQHEPDAQPHVECASCGRAYFANPKPCTTALAEHPDGRLLLVRRAIEPFLGYWDLPGGFMEEGEHAPDAVLRELLEETGLRGELLGLLSVHPDRYGERHASTLNLFYRVRVENPGDACAASDVAELGWFPCSELPPRDELAFECVPAAIADWIRLRDRAG